MNQSVDRSFVLKMFNLDEDRIDTFFMSHQDEKVVVQVTLKRMYSECPACGGNACRIKDYRMKHITHSVLKATHCVIAYRARRYQCKVCHKSFYEHNPFTFNGKRISLATVYNVLEDLKSIQETFASVALRHNLSAPSVMNIFDQHVYIPRLTLPSILCM